MPDTDERSPKKFLRLRRRWNGPGSAPSQWPAPRKPITNVREILDENLDQDRKAGRYDLKSGLKRRSRRGWDFLWMAIAGNSAGVGFLWWAEANAPTVLLVVAAMIFYTLAIGWVLLVHHDEY